MRSGAHEASGSGLMFLQTGVYQAHEPGRSGLSLKGRSTSLDKPIRPSATVSRFRIVSHMPCRASLVAS
jgi:hypothetical protein